MCVCVCEGERESVCMCDVIWYVCLYVYFWNCHSKLHILLSPGASEKFLSLWPFSLYYCVKLMLSEYIDVFVVCSFTWHLHFFSLA